MPLARVGLGVSSSRYSGSRISARVRGGARPIGQDAAMSSCCQVRLVGFSERERPARYECLVESIIGVCGVGGELPDNQCLGTAAGVADGRGRGGDDGWAET